MENLKSVIFENLSHKHLYVRKNALVCLISIIDNFGTGVLPNTIVETLKDIIEKDTDSSTKRNAYLALAKIDTKESILITKEILSTTDINELGDLFTLAIVDNLKNLCKVYTKEKSKLIKLLLDLSSHKSHSVLYEIGNSLLQLSGNPETVRNAVNILCNLLIEQKDNNTLILILKKLIEVKNKYHDILEEQIVSFARILDSNCTNELRRLLFEIISDLIKGSNIAAVFEIFISDFNKLGNVSDTDATIEFKNLILMCMYKNIKKYPSLNHTYPLFLLNKCLLYDSKKTFTNDQITIIKDLFVIFPDHVNEFIQRIIGSFEDINSSEILQACIWILAEYTKDLNLFKKIFDVIMKNMGDLNLELTEQRNNDTIVATEKKVITKTVVLPDGTYGTQTIVVDPTENNRQRETKFLRNFILETNFFFSTTLVVALTKIVIEMYYLDESENKEVFNTYFYNTINIICAVLKMESEKIFKDPDNTSRINMCLECLINNDFDSFRSWIKESRKLSTDAIKEEEADGSGKSGELERITNVDEPLIFRHVKQYDPDNTGDEESTIDYNSLNKHDFNHKKQNHKYTEVLTGSEVKVLWLNYRTLYK